MNRNRAIGLSLLLFLLVIVVMVQFSKIPEPDHDNDDRLPATTPSISEQVRFSLEFGWYEQEQQLELTTPSLDSLQIRYTLDGIEPSMNAVRYSKKIVLNADVVVRARAYREDGAFGPETIGLFSVGNRPSLPVFSIVADPELLWSEEEGIYVIGKNGNRKPPYDGANFWEDWEVPVHLQYFDHAGILAFEGRAGMELFGGESRMQPQKSIELLAKKKYGKKQFEYRFFEQLDRKEFDSLILRNGGQDFPLTHMRDSLASLLAEPILKDVQAYRPVVVYLNGQYWGIHDLREKMDESLISARYGYTKKSIDLLESDGEVKAGNDKNFHKLLELLEKDIPREERVHELISFVDVESLFDYMIFEAYIGNTDWPDHNIRYWRSDEGDGKWRWLLYDADLSFQDAKEPSLTRLLSPELSRYPSVRIFQDLLQEPELKEQFLIRFREILYGPLDRDPVISKIEAVRKMLAPEMERHQVRWDGTVDHWNKEVNKLLAFAEFRRDELLDQLQGGFQLTDAQMLDYGLTLAHPDKEVIINHAVRR